MVIAHLVHIEATIRFDFGFGFVVALKSRAVEMDVAFAVVALVFLQVISFCIGTDNTCNDSHARIQTRVQAHEPLCRSSTGAGNAACS